MDGLYHSPILFYLFIVINNIYSISFMICVHQGKSNNFVFVYRARLISSGYVCVCVSVYVWVWMRFDSSSEIKLMYVK